MEEKRRCIEPEHRELSITRQCELMGLARASYYRSMGMPESEENLALMRLIDEEYTRHPFYGSRKMRDYLRRQGQAVNRKRVQRLMQRMGLVSIAPKPNTSPWRTKHTGFIRICCGEWISPGPIKCGVATSLTSAWREALCTSPR